jgi:hypothetical protein
MIPFVIADASLTVPLDVVLWVAGTVVTVVGVLLGIIYNSIKSKIKENNDRCNALEKGVNDNVEKLYNRINEERKERTAKHDELAHHIGSDLEKTKEKVDDLTVTVAGIGSVYVTRNEYTQAQNRPQR